MVKPLKPKTFGEKRQEQYEKDRYRLETGIKFVITRIADVKELTDFSVVLIDGKDIQDNPVKYYASGKAIVNQCKELLTDSSPDGTLKEPIEVETITKRARKINKDYVCFKSDISESPES